MEDITAHRGFRGLLKKYGKTFILTLSVLWVLELFFWMLVLSFGTSVDSLLGWLNIDPNENRNGGIFVLALLISQVTKIPRLGFTALITPWVSRTISKKFSVESSP